MNVDAIVRHALISHFLLLDRGSKKAIRVPRLPQNGTMIDFHEFKGFVEIRRVSDHLVNHQIWHRG